MIIESKHIGKNVINSEVTIIMPIYNRSHFLKQAFDSLNRQTYKNWTLVIVDDGSNDDCWIEIVRLLSFKHNSLLYIKQENGGPGVARQTGINHAPKTEFYAFFDSDDEWGENYLMNAISYLKYNPDIDWLYQACKRIDHYTGDTLLESTFLTAKGDKVPFYSLPIEYRGRLGIFTNNRSTVLEQIKSPLNAGFQNSVIRQKVTTNCKIPSYRIGEDRYFFSLTLIKGFKVAFLENVGVVYHVHNGNVSNTNDNRRDLNKSEYIQNELVASYHDLLTQINDVEIQQALKKAMANILFWHIGYQIHLNLGNNRAALTSMKKAIVYYPTNLKFYKTITSTFMKYSISRVKQIIRSDCR